MQNPSVPPARRAHSGATPSRFARVTRLASHLRTPLAADARRARRASRRGWAQARREEPARPAVALSPRPARRDVSYPTKRRSSGAKEAAILRWLRASSPLTLHSRMRCSPVALQINPDLSPDLRLVTFGGFQAANAAFFAPQPAGHIELLGAHQAACFGVTEVRSKKRSSTSAPRRARCSRSYGARR